MCRQRYRAFSVGRRLVQATGKHLHKRGQRRDVLSIQPEYLYRLMPAISGPRSSTHSHSVEINDRPSPTFDLSNWIRREPLNLSLASRVRYTTFVLTATRRPLKAAFAIRERKRRHSRNERTGLGEKRRDGFRSGK